MSAINRDTVVAVILLLICGVFYAASFEIEETTYATIGAEVWPRLILGVMLVLSAIYLFQSLRRAPVETEGAQAGSCSSTHSRPRGASTSPPGVPT